MIEIKEKSTKSRYTRFQWCSRKLLKALLSFIKLKIQSFCVLKLFSSEIWTVNLHESMITYWKATEIKFKNDLCFNAGSKCLGGTKIQWKLHHCHYFTTWNYGNVNKLLKFLGGPSVIDNSFPFEVFQMESHCWLCEGFDQSVDFSKTEWKNS